MNPISEDVKFRGAYIIPSRYRQSSPGVKTRQGSPSAGAKIRQLSPLGKLVRHVSPASKRSISAGKRDASMDSNRRWSSIYSSASCVKPEVVDAQSMKSGEEAHYSDGKENVSLQQNKEPKSSESKIQVS